WISTREHLQRAIGAYALAGGALAILSLLGTTWTNKVVGVDQLTERLPQLLRGLPGAEPGLHPNEVGGALLWVVLPVLGLTGWAWASPWPGSYRNWIARLGLLSLAILTGGTLFLTQSVSAWIGAVSGLVLLI